MPLNDLEHFRNRIAHGGSLNSWSQKALKNKDISKIYENGRDAVDFLLKICSFS